MPVRKHKAKSVSHLQKLHSKTPHICVVYLNLLPRNFLSRHVFSLTLFCCIVGILHACVLSLFSCGRLFETLWTVTRQESSETLCSWDSPGKNTRVGCLFLLQRIFPIQGSNTLLLCLTSFKMLFVGRDGSKEEKGGKDEVTVIQTEHCSTSVIFRLLIIV